MLMGRGSIMILFPDSFVDDDFSRLPCLILLMIFTYLGMYLYIDQTYIRPTKYVVNLFYMLIEFLFACFDSLHASQQFFAHVGMGLPGLNQYLAADKVSCSRTQHSDSTSHETRT